MNLRYIKYLQFVNKYKESLGDKGSWRKGEIEIVTDSKLFDKCEDSAAKQMVKEGVLVKEARKRAQIGIREENRWGVSVCEPVKLPPDGQLSTFVRFIPWGQLEEGNAGFIIVPILSDGRLVLLKNFRNAIRKWCLEFPRATQDPKTSLSKIMNSELRYELGAKIKGKAKYLGTLTPDSGVLMSFVKVYLVKVEIIGKINPEVTEAIEGLVMATKKDINKFIRQGKYKENNREYPFIDVYSIGAYTLASSKKMI